MRKFLAILAILGMGLASSACAHHHHAKRPKTVVPKLASEHNDPKIVVVHKERAPSAHCWKHSGHWHCRH